MPRRSWLAFVPFIVASVVVGCKTSGNDGSDVKIDAADVLPLDAQIVDGILLSAKKASDAEYIPLIRAQLAYSLGQLNANEGSANANRLDVLIKEVKAVGDGATVEVHYTTTLVLGWPKRGNTPPPKVFQLIVPAELPESETQEIFTSYSQAFYDAFKDKCFYESADHANLYWHDFDPRASECPLKEMTASTAVGSEVTTVANVKVVRIALEPVTSAQATEGKKPEYDQIWRDGKLVVTAVYAKDSPSSTKPSDAGTDTYNQAYKQLVAAFGKPVKSNVQLAAGAKPGPKKTQLDLTFKTPAGIVEAHLFLVGTLRPSEADLADPVIGPPYELFKTQYPTLTQTSDFVIYSGHSSYGKNIREFLRLAQQAKGQHTIYWLDGCDTFTYLDSDIRGRVEAVNPGQSPYKYVDFIANAMPAPFGVEVDSMAHLVKALVAKKATYREILSGLDHEQRALVYGEEDNGALFP